jgi:hypothetical protein
MGSGSSEHFMIGLFRWVSVSGCPGGPLATAYSIQGNIEITILCLKKENYKGDE